MEVSQDILEAFHSLFKGRVDAYGSVEGRANKEPVTLEHYRKHLRGEVSLGVYLLLDDGSCHFAVVDLDEKDFSKAYAIRQELSKEFIPAYIAESKSKGFHIYVFSLEKFVAKDIRRVLHHILAKLNINTEVFPKQDSLSATTPLGSYINLCCFGHTRPFLAVDSKGAPQQVPLEVALERIKGTPAESIERVFRTLPEEKPPVSGKARGRQKKHPPCIASLLLGVKEPGRDEAAFALARHYLDCGYALGDILSLLKEWDQNNKPPLRDDRLLEIKVTSASEKDYPFGCGSIRDNPILSEFCVGQENCQWWKDIIQKREESDRYIVRNKKDEPIKVKIKPLIDDLINEFVFKTVFGFVRDDILVYENGVYTYDAEKVIRRECEERVGAPMMTTHTAGEIRNHIARRTFTDREGFNTEKYIINLENGLLDINSMELKPHAPEFLSTIRIPIAYDPQATCPKIQSFLDNILRPNDKNIILQFFGYSLIPDYSIPVVLVLLGEGSNGKTQLLRLLAKFIGPRNFTAVSLQDIEDNSFAISNLEGKLLNMQGDLSSKRLSGIGMLKQLSGQDPLFANRKHRDAIQFDNFARLVFASNKPPQIEEDTLAIWRRILPLDLPNKFEGQNDIKHIVETIATPWEMSGLLNLALEGLRQVLDKGDFSYLGSYEDRAKHYTIASDPARAFTEERCDIGKELKVLKPEMYEAYSKFCKEKKVQLSGEPVFGKDLRSVPGSNITDQQIHEKGVRVRWWVGIALKTPEPDSAGKEIDMEV